MAKSEGGIPPHLSALINRLRQSGAIFVEVYKSKEKRFQDIVREFTEISGEVQEVQRDTNSAKKLWAVFGGVGLAGVTGAALLALGSPSTGGAVKMAALGVGALFVGGAGVAKENNTKAKTEKQSIERVKKLGEEFMTDAELLMDLVKEIHKASVELKENSSSLRTTTEGQAKIILSTSKKLQQLIRQTEDLAERSRRVSLTTMSHIRDLINLLLRITQVTSDVKEDAKLRKFLSESAVQWENTVNEFAKMRDLLADFEEDDDLRTLLDASSLK